MGSKIKSTKTAEQRRIEAEQLHETITAQVEALANTEAWTQFLNFAQHFHAYSLNNVLLILAQRPDATQVAGFRKWQELGRQVRKGERSIKIFGYAERKAREGEDTSGMRRNAKGEYVVPYFPMLSVFDVAQTESVDAAAEPRPLAEKLTGADEHGIYAAAADYLTAAGWHVERANIDSGANGYTKMDGSRRIVIETALTDAQAAKTLLHEAAHALLHVDDAPGSYVQHRGLKECEAESVAYIVAGIMGLDTSAYSVGYIAGWTDANADVLRETAANVLRAAHTIADAITEPVTEQAAA